VARVKTRACEIVATELLSKPLLPTRDVARLVGYSQPPHFARAFRRHYGVSPSVFRAAIDSRTAVDWRTWHEDYTDPDSALGQRLAVVQAQVRAALDRSAPGFARAISICAGQGHDLIGVLAGHPRRADVTARLVELDEHNALLARRAAKEAGLGGVEAVAADASMTDAYEGAVPADLVLLCGVFGNISAEDIANTVSHLPRLCAPEATVIWTRHRHPPDLTPYIRETFEHAGFSELAFEDSPPFGVGANRLLVPPQPFTSGVRLFEFIGYDVLQPDFHASQGGT
jgi:Helix-turn-helix domain